MKEPNENKSTLKTILLALSSFALAVLTYFIICL